MPCHCASGAGQREQESFIAELLREAGSEIVVKSEYSVATNRQRLDLAVWSDALEHITGNPLVVEVKPNGGDIRAATAQAGYYAQQIGARWAVVIYFGPEVTGPLHGANVLVFSAEPLVRRLAGQSLDSILRSARNVAVHGL